MANKEIHRAGYAIADSGYDYNFVDPPPDRLVCKICQFPCSKAQLSECCGHVYCLPCLAKVKAIRDGDYLCPMCRAPNFKSIAHHEADRTIKELQVYCPNKVLGRGKCEWVGALGDVDKHLKECKMQCRRCGVLLGYYSMVRHLASSSCLCKHCHSKQQCYCLVSCPNQCGQDILRDEIDEHKKLCPFELIQCDYHCGAKITRCEKQAHYKNCQVEHFQLMCNEKFNNIYGEIKSNATEISELKSIEENCNKEAEIAFDMAVVKQSIIGIEQITTDCHEKSEQNRIALSYHGKLLVTIIFMLAILTVMVMLQMQAQLQGNNINTSAVMHDSSDILTQTKHACEDKAAESMSHNYETSKESNTSENKVSWLSRHESFSDHDQILPVILKMMNFTEKRKNKEPWYSVPFFVSRDGCQMCLRVDASGYKDTHISVYLYMKDLYDIRHRGHCNWPLRGKFAIELLNQFSDSTSTHHHQNMMITHNPGIDKNVDENLSFSGWGCYDFISHKILSKSGHIYSGNDTLYFRIIYEDTPTNVVHASTLHVQTLSDYFIEYLRSPLLAVFFVACVAEVAKNWIANYLLFGIFMILLLVLVGSYFIGNLVGGMLWFVAISLIAQFSMTNFPVDQQYLGFYCFLLTTVVVKILLVDVLHMPWGLIWGIL